MTHWTIQEIIDATEGRLLRGDAGNPINGISIDSRSILPGQAFVAIHGKRFDGHYFINEAVHKGAACVILSEGGAPTNGARRVPTISVSDTTQALGDLASFHRRRFDIPVVAVTGSCGKTTTKELIAHLMGDSFRILKSPGSYNNQFGLPLALLEITSDHDVAVVELGSNHPGEIAYLASITQPTVAVITNVGPVHLEYFGSLIDILQEKLSLLEELPGDGTAILPGDQLDVCLEARNFLHPRARLVYFGTTDRCDIQALDIHRLDTPGDRRQVQTGKGMSVRLRDRIQEFIVPLMGYHNVENALAALTCAWTLGVPMEITRKRLRTFPQIAMRSEVVRFHGVTLINDCYNANPLSFARALEMLRDIRASRKVAIMGDMLELGDFAPSAHEAIGRLAMQMGIDEVIAVGEYAEHVAKGVAQTHRAKATTFRSVAELLEGLPGRLRKGDGVLVKGSRKLNLEQVAQHLRQHYRRD